MIMEEEAGHFWGKSVTKMSDILSCDHEISKCNA